MKIDIASVLVDAITKTEALARIDEFVKSGQPHYIVTVYSEFIVFASGDPEYASVLNKADLSLADGSGILWAAKYLSMNGSVWLEPFKLAYSGASLVFAPGFVKTVLPEKISGSGLIWDIAKLASQKNYSMALVGGGDSVAERSAAVLKAKYPALRVNLALSGMPFDDETARKISESNSDILCIAYQPPKQEKWIAQNLDRLNVKVGVGLGGTFDYLSGSQKFAPEWVSSVGLEWLYRLATQPHRWKRMWNAIPVFISIIYSYKLKHGKN